MEFKLYDELLTEIGPKDLESYTSLVMFLDGEQMELMTAIILHHAYKEGVVTDGKLPYGMVENMIGNGVMVFIDELPILLKQVLVAYMKRIKSL